MIKKTLNSKITIHMVASLDGFIAKKDGSVDWMHTADTYEKGETLTEEYIEEYLNSIDCYVMGARTYENALKLGWPYGGKPVIVLTNQVLPNDRATVSFYKGDLAKLVNEQLKPTYKNIWMVGGAETTKAFLQQQLADDLIISFLPIILGDGLLFFDFIGQEQALHLKDVTAYKDGMVEMWYELKKIK